MWWKDQPCPQRDLWKEAGQKQEAGREQGLSGLLAAALNLPAGQSQEGSHAQGTHTLGRLHQCWDEKQLGWAGVSAASDRHLLLGERVTGQVKKQREAAADTGKLGIPNPHHPMVLQPEHHCGEQ